MLHTAKLLARCPAQNQNGRTRIQRQLLDRLDQNPPGMEELGYNGKYQTDQIKIRLEGTSAAVESVVAFLHSTMDIIDDFEMDNEAAKFVRRYIIVRSPVSAPSEQLPWDNRDD